MGVWGDVGVCVGRVYGGGGRSVCAWKEGLGSMGGCVIRGGCVGDMGGGVNMCGCVYSHFYYCV